uniref:Synaptobrevin, longin-like domain protein n=1 Tax=Tanacetum cinerariifolium TaxID=118510 RepID=A0A6L2KZI6_TANCI|nr:hypothetical protein [Tanacetum cinerariifolium]
MSLVSQFWVTVLIKKANDVGKLQALIDRKKVVITEDVMCQALHLDDADGVECLPNEEIFTELARVGYEKPPPKLTMVRNVDSPSKFLMYPQFLQVIINAQVEDLSSHNNQYTSPTLTQKIFANIRSVGKGFSGVETPLFAIMIVQPQSQATEEEDEVVVPTAPTPPSPLNALSSPPQTPIPTPPRAQPAPPSSPPQEQQTDTSESSMFILNTLMETCATLSQKVTQLEQDKIAQAVEILKLKKMVKKLKKQRRSNSFGLKRLRKVGTSQRVESSTETVMGAQEDASKQEGRIEAIDADEDITLVDAKTQADVELQERKDDGNAVIKEVSAADSTVFDDEEVTMTMDQTLIKMKAEKARLVDEQMAKRLHDEEVEQVAAREKQEKDDLEKDKGLQQHLKRKPASIAQARKNMIIYLKNMCGYKMEHFKGMTYDKGSFKKLKVVEVSGSHSTQDTLTNDLKEMSEEDVKNMLEIVLVSEFKVEALQVKVGGITKSYQSFKDMLKGFDREDMDALWRLVKEKFSTTVPTVDKEKALWVELTILFEPITDDVFWKLQRYTHDPLTWKLYTNCGVHHVSSTRRRDIFMLTEKNYPLSNDVIIMMLSAKLQVEEDSEMARDLVMKIFMEANKPKSRTKALENYKGSFSIPTGCIFGEVGLNTFRNNIAAHYLPYSSEYVAPPSIDVVKKWFLMIGYREEVLTKGTLRKSLLPPRWSVNNWALKPNQPKEPPFTNHMLAICALDKPLVFKALKTSSKAESVSQGVKHGAKTGHKKLVTSSKQPFVSNKEVTKGGSFKESTGSKTGHSKRRKESSLAMDSNPNRPSVSTLVDTKMHKEDQQATGGPTSLKVTSEERANPQLSSGDFIAEADPRLSASNAKVKSAQAKLKTLDALLSLLLNVTKALNKFVKGEKDTNQATISQLFQRRADKIAEAEKENMNQQPKSTTPPTTTPINPLIITTTTQMQTPLQSPPRSSSQPEGEHIKKDKGKKVMSSEEAEKKSTESDSDKEAHVTGFMVKSSKEKKLKKYDFVTEDRRHIYFSETQINNQKKLKEEAKVEAAK